MVLMDRVYSSAVDASRPRLELSQATTEARLTRTSAMETRFLSPPETPRTNSFPTRVSAACSMPKVLRRTFKDSVDQSDQGGLVRDLLKTGGRFG